ncbi:hypothetical protein [Hymenobacter volaticus]|uniref:Uncharacterized protein n=1 Tax=Hymenobacter volaticus TaxID=2932254 RepID=A0ABY4G2H9_9BACT|nr:hypothetical protein [Hymenobacter volaticus]UOQ64779.1 hypothetical protein MUN86_14520 [Hymenobacter volaticus]
MKYFLTDAWWNRELRPWESVLPNPATRHVNYTEAMLPEHWKKRLAKEELTDQRRQSVQHSHAKNYSIKGFNSTVQR